MAHTVFHQEPSTDFGSIRDLKLFGDDDKYNSFKNFNVPETVSSDVFSGNQSYGPAYSNIGNKNFYASPGVYNTAKSNNFGLQGGNDSGFGLNLGTFGMISNALGGIGSLAKGYAAIKGLGLARDELAFKREAFDKNFVQQKQAYDDSIRQYNNIQGERQAFVNATHANPSLSNIKTLQLA